MSDDFYRRAVAFRLRNADPGDGLTLEGYAAVFDSPTLINDWDGEYEETVARGAFRKTLREQTPVLQFDHGQHPVVGSMPIGAVDTLAEDDHGLLVRARLFDNWMTEPLRDAIRAQAVDGMSFRFQVTRETWEEPSELGQLRKRTLKEVRLFELGPVVFPAYKDTTVALRSLAAHVPGVTLTFADPESGTSTDAATEARGTSDDAATDSNSAPAPPSHPEPRDHSWDARKRVARQIQAGRRAA
jgi:HK97 family phage prohead protease